MIWWDPVADGDLYFRELVRMKLMSDVASGGPKADQSSHRFDLEAEIAENRFAEVLRYSIHRAFYESIKKQRLIDLVGNDPARVLLVEISRGRTLNNRNEQVRQGVAGKAWSIDVEVFQGEIAWWFSGGRDQRLNQALSESAVSWLKKEMVGRA